MSLWVGLCLVPLSPSLPWFQSSPKWKFLYYTSSDDSAQQFFRWDGDEPLPISFPLCLFCCFFTLIYGPLSSPPVPQVSSSSALSCIKPPAASKRKKCDEWISSESDRKGRKVRMRWWRVKCCRNFGAKIYILWKELACVGCGAPLLLLYRTISIEPRSTSHVINTVNSSFLAKKEEEGNLWFHSHWMLYLRWTKCA